MSETAVIDAVSTASSGDTVLLSPACPGFFSRHYEQGTVGSKGFKALLRNLAIDRPRQSEDNND